VLRFALSRIQIRFKDRSAAGTILADILKSRIRNYRSRDGQNVIVLGIPRGGVVLADIIARKMSVEFGVLVAMKLGQPDNKEKAIGAITEDGTTYLDQKLIGELEISQNYVEKERSEREEEIRYETSLYRSGKSLLRDIKGKAVILVDDGAATGATVVAAARSVMKQGAHHLTIALPVAPTAAVDLLKHNADDVEVILTSPFEFYSISQYYENFLPVTIEQVLRLIHNREG
jgi:predicted phosphoribosyltransferase